MTPFFIFDVESIGLHGQAFAVAGGVYDRDGNALHEFAYHCDSMRADGEFSDREWVAANVTISIASKKKAFPKGVRESFWNEWLEAKEKWPGITMRIATNRMTPGAGLKTSVMKSLRQKE